MLKKQLIILILLNSYLFSLEVDLLQNKLLNSSPYITSQCYTKTKDDKNLLHNPCYSCHSKNKEPNYTMGDDDLQEAYDFPGPALKNPWTNLFKDRTKEVSKISDKEILDYINKSNYIKTKKYP
jgi:hypothetical protein